MFRSCLSCIPMGCFRGAVANDYEIATTAEIGIFGDTANFDKNPHHKIAPEEELQRNKAQLDEKNLGIINSPQLFILPQLAKDDGVTPINIASVQNAGFANSEIINSPQLFILPQPVKNSDPIVSNSPSNIISGALGHKNNTNTLREKLPIVLKVRPLEKGENMLGREFFN